jgi:hypothetical protein
LRNLAQCEEALGHWASARRAWLDLKRGLIVQRDAKYAGWDREAETSSTRLAPKVATLTVDIVSRSNKGEGPLDPSSKVEVLLNGEALDRSLVGTEVDRDPGTYRIRLQGDDVATPVEQQVDLVAGDAKRLLFRVNLREPLAATAVPPHVEDGGHGMRTAGYILLGVGGVSVVASVVSLAVRQTALGDLSSQCPSYQSETCDPSLRSTVDRGKLASTLTTVFGVAGVAALAAGALLVLVQPKAPAKTGLTVKARVAGLDAEWRF